MNTIHTKPKMATQHNNGPCTLLIKTVLIKLYDGLINEDNIKQELTWVWPILMSTVAPAHY